MTDNYLVELKNKLALQFSDLDFFIDTRKNLAFEPLKRSTVVLYQKSVKVTPFIPCNSIDLTLSNVLGNTTQVVIGIDIYSETSNCPTIFYHLATVLNQLGYTDVVCSAMEYSVKYSVFLVSGTASNLIIKLDDTTVKLKPNKVCLDGITIPFIITLNVLELANRRVAHNIIPNAPITVVNYPTEYELEIKRVKTANSQVLPTMNRNHTLSLHYDKITLSYSLLSIDRIQQILTKDYCIETFKCTGYNKIETSVI